MNRNEAKKLAETVTPDELKQMLINARNKVTNWEQHSVVNRHMDKGTAFNIFTKCGINEKTHIMAKVNMLREFGEFLPNYTPVKKKKIELPENIRHEQPCELDDIFK